MRLYNGIFISISMLALAACNSTNDTNRTVAEGAGAGVLAGALVGALVDGKRGAIRGGLIGGTAGVVAGGIVANKKKQHIAREDAAQKTIAELRDTLAELASLNQTAERQLNGSKSKRATIERLKIAARKGLAKLERLANRNDPESRKIRDDLNAELDRAETNIRTA